MANLVTNRDQARPSVERKLLWLTAACWASITLIAMALVGCGAAESLNKLENQWSVAGGGLDPSLLGTFRLYEEQYAQTNMLRLLVLRRDLTFHGELVADQATASNSPSVSTVDGIYEQIRELRDPSRSAGVIIRGHYIDAQGAVGYLEMELRRCAVPDSPQVGLYHSASFDAAANAPFFQMSHPRELWCASIDDCQGQTPSLSSTTSVCADGQCVSP